MPATTTAIPSVTLDAVLASFGRCSPSKSIRIVSNESRYQDREGLTSNPDGAGDAECVWDLVEERCTRQEHTLRCEGLCSQEARG
jgi:hypothetical protein